jgi:hypothetical protein
MIITKRQPVSVGEMLIEEFMEPLADTHYSTTPTFQHSLWGEAPNLLYFALPF